MANKTKKVKKASKKKVKKASNTVPLTFRVTATIIKDITVEVDTDELGEGFTQDDIESKGMELANEMFNPNCDGNDENYSQDAELIDNDES